MLYLILISNIYSSALVVIDNESNEISSDDLTIDIMSSGDDEHIDITNDLDPPESTKHYTTNVNSSVLEQAQE